LDPEHPVAVSQEFLFESALFAMERLYRIEIDVLLDDRLRHKVIQAARKDYEKSEGYWTEEEGERVRIPAEEFVIDTKTAFLEIAESGLLAPA
jgi:hypothetical protein